MILGVDIIVMALVALLCGAVCFLICVATGVSEEIGNAVMLATSSTAALMFVCYIIMARVLDTIIGYWW